MTDDASGPSGDVSSDEATEQDQESYQLDLDASSTLEEALEEAVAALEGDETDDESDDAGPDEGEGGGQDLVAKLQESEARYLRLLADFENFRKRSEREVERIKRYALQQPVRAFLEAIDNLERAMAAGGSVEDLKTGLEMTIRGLGEALRKHGIEAVETVGQPFDPALHEAVSRRDDPDVEEAIVVGEMQRGYRLHDRLIRPAMVVVAVPAGGKASS